MATPYRVKRGGKQIGSFLVVVDGQRVNLGTQDATEARRRARLAAKGLWPPADKVAADVSAALDTGETPPDVGDVEGIQDVPPAPNAGSQSQKVDGQQSAPAPAVTVDAEQIDPVVAANAAAAESVGGPEDLSSEAAKALSESGVDLAELTADMPKHLGGAHLWLQGQVARGLIRLFKGKAPKLVTLPEDEPLRLMIGRLWKPILDKLGFRLENITPGWWLVILSGVTVFMQSAAMLAQLAEDEAKSEGPSGAGQS